MRDVTPQTITQAFMDYCGPDTDPRLKFLLAKLSDHLHDFVRETKLTHAEWRKTIEVLTASGEITDDKRNEFILLSDVLGVSSLVDMVNSPEGATEASVLGPFHILGAPPLAYGGDLKAGNAGDYVVVSGQVRDAEGAPISGAELEIWQTADNGLYSNIDPDQDDFNLRARIKTGADGRYLLTTVRPAPYTVPDDGPVGELLHATGRHPWRPSHLHFIVMGDGYRSLTTELFPDDDPYIDEDAVFGVRTSLMTHYQRQDDLSKLPDGLAVAEKITAPFYTVDFDFNLVRENRAGT